MLREEGYVERYKKGIYKRGDSMSKVSIIIPSWNGWRKNNYENK